MKAIVVGCGRVGSSLARSLADEGWEVVVVEQREESLARLGPEWRHQLVIGHGMDAGLARLLALGAARLRGSDGPWNSCLARLGPGVASAHCAV